jgi:hypothetical protein
VPDLSSLFLACFLPPPDRPTRTIDSARDQSFGFLVLFFHFTFTSLCPQVRPLQVCGPSCLARFEPSLASSSRPLLCVRDLPGLGRPSVSTWERLNLAFLVFRPRALTTASPTPADSAVVIVSSTSTLSLRPHQALRRVCRIARVSPSSLRLGPGRISVSFPISFPPASSSRLPSRVRNLTTLGRPLTPRLGNIPILFPLSSLSAPSLSLRIADLPQNFRTHC